MLDRRLKNSVHPIFLEGYGRLMSRKSGTVEHVQPYVQEIYSAWLRLSTPRAGPRRVPFPSDSVIHPSLSPKCMQQLYFCSSFISVYPYYLLYALFSYLSFLFFFTPLSPLNPSTVPP